MACPRPPSWATVRTSDCWLLTPHLLSRLPQPPSPPCPAPFRPSRKTLRAWPGGSRDQALSPGGGRGGASWGMAWGGWGGVLVWLYRVLGQGLAADGDESVRWAGVSPAGPTACATDRPAAQAWTDSEPSAPIPHQAQKPLEEPLRAGQGTKAWKAELGANRCPGPPGDWMSPQRRGEACTGGPHNG